MSAETNLEPDATGHVVIEGHRVDADEIDRYFDGRTGRRVTDEEWDEDKRRRMKYEAE